MHAREMENTQVIHLSRATHECIHEEMIIKKKLGRKEQDENKLWGEKIMQIFSVYCLNKLNYNVCIRRYLNFRNC